MSGCPVVVLLSQRDCVLWARGPEESSQCLNACRNLLNGGQVLPQGEVLWKREVERCCVKEFVTLLVSIEEKLGKMTIHT